jgi:hypothetical protein
MKRIALLMAVLVCAACGGPDRVHLIAEGDLPPGLFASPTPRPTTEPQRHIRVWLIKGGQLRPVQRASVGDATLAGGVLRSMLTGPTAAERAAGYSTAVPVDAELLGVEVSDGTATVNLSKEFELSAEGRVLVLRLGQVVYTLTEVPGVTDVAFRIDGIPELVVGQDGRARDVVGRLDYANVAPPLASPKPTPGGLA